jgi:hypothetical protein
MHIGRDRSDGNACVNLGTAPLVSLNRLPLQLSHLVTSPDLSFTLLSDKQSGILAANRHPADVIERDLDIPASKVCSPTFNWRRQVQLEMGAEAGRPGPSHQAAVAG